MEYVETLTSKNEVIVIKTRRHWIALANPILTNIVFAIAILVMIHLVGDAGTPANAFTILILFPFSLMVRDYLRWWNEQYLVTNRRVIQSMGIFNKKVIDSSLDKVNDVVLTQSLIGRIMDFGNVEILTASEIGVNDLHTIRSPVRFKTEMINQKEKLAPDDYMYANSAKGQQNDIPSIIGLLDDLRKKGVLTDEEFQNKKTHLLAKM